MTLDQIGGIQKYFQELLLEALGSFTYYNNFLKFVKFEMGKGDKIQFWEDDSIGEN